MTKLERAIEALEALPAHRQEELMDSIIREAEALAKGADSALTEEQLAEVHRRLDRGFRPAPADAIDRLLDRLK